MSCVNTALALVRHQPPVWKEACHHVRVDLVYGPRFGFLVMFTDLDLVYGLRLLQVHIVVMSPGIYPSYAYFIWCPRDTRLSQEVHTCTI